MLCLWQTDLKALIAYSSVAHMRLLVNGVMSNSKLGEYDRLIIVLTHGISSSYLFFLSNLLNEKTNIRDIILTGGSLIFTPYNSLIWIVATIINIAIPPRLHILGEIIIIITSFFICKIIIIMHYYAYNNFLFFHYTYTL